MKDELKNIKKAIKKFLMKHLKYEEDLAELELYEITEETKNFLIAYRFIETTLINIFVNVKERKIVREINLPERVYEEKSFSSIEELTDFIERVNFKDLFTFENEETYKLIEAKAVMNQSNNFELSF